MEVFNYHMHQEVHKYCQKKNGYLMSGMCWHSELKWVAANQSWGNLEPLWIRSCPLPTREGSLEKCHNSNLNSVKKVGRFMGEWWSWIFGVWGLNQGNGPLGMESNENWRKGTIAEIKYLAESEAKSVYLSALWLSWCDSGKKKERPM